MIRTLTLVGLAALSSGWLTAAAQAGENKVVKCHMGAAIHAPLKPGPALVADVPRSMSPIALDAVQVTGKKLAKQVLVEGLFARRTATESVEVMARFVNCTKETVSFQARVSFMDAGQFPTEPSSAWKQVFLSPYATGTYQEISVGRDAVKNFLVETREVQ